MAAQKRQMQRAGGQLNRTETVTVRLDPKLNYLCELAARSQRRTKSSLIEAALADVLNVIPVDPRPTTEEVRPSISGSAELLWHVDEVERLRRLAMFAPHLMTYDEQKIWATISRNGFFWHGHWEFYGQDQAIFTPDVNPDKLVVFRVEEHWETIKAVALENTPAAALPQAVYLYPWDDQMLQSTLAPPAPQTNGLEGDANV